ncbi:MAG: hypothetical protein PHC62_00490 [Candidatus Izemoplasmatales bacterium]|nr:hypothetical protein [Candidatus Izemoplasmatales bacterium]
MAGRFSNTTYKDTVTSIVGSAKEMINNPYYIWANKTPTEVDYYNINIKASTLDEGSSLEYATYGPNSPLKFNRVKGLMVYGLEQIQISLTHDDFGLQGDMITGDGFVLPNTVVPVSGDYFAITYINERHIFHVVDVSFDTLDTGANMYKFTYELSSVTIDDIECNVIEDYTFIIQNMGTDFNPVIRDSIFDHIKKIDKLAETLKEYFISLYYNERVQTFTFQFLQHNFYDPYMIQFLMDNDVINYNGASYVYIGHQTPIKHDFPLLYRETFFRALEKKDKEHLRSYETQAMGTQIKHRMSTFYNRPEVFFELTYQSPVKDWGVVPTFFNELLDHIESGELFEESEGNFYIYNIIIKYFNDKPINSIDLDLVERFNFKRHHMLFYAIPAVIFCLNCKLNDLMEKE